MEGVCARVWHPDNERPPGILDRLLVVHVLDGNPPMAVCEVRIGFRKREGCLRLAVSAGF